MNVTNYPPGVLQNRLANERTLLAWLRTAVALMGFGLLVARLSNFLDAMIVTSGGKVEWNHSRWTGAALLLAGSVVAVTGYARTRAYARAIDPEGLPPSGVALTGTAIVVTLLGVVLAALLFALA